MEIYNEMRQWLAERRQHKADTIDSRIRLEAEEAAQIREFAGRLFITVDGRPAIDCGQLKGSPLEALEGVRSNIYQYLRSVRHEGK